MNNFIFSLKQNNNDKIRSFFILNVKIMSAKYLDKKNARKVKMDIKS